CIRTTLLTHSTALEARTTRCNPTLTRQYDDSQPAPRPRTTNDGSNDATTPADDDASATAAADTSRQRHQRGTTLWARLRQSQLLVQTIEEGQGTPVQQHTPHLGPTRTRQLLRRRMHFALGPRSLVERTIGTPHLQRGHRPTPGRLLSLRLVKTIEGLGPGLLRLALVETPSVAAATIETRLDTVCLIGLLPKAL